MTTENKNINISLVGASFSNANLGVNALAESSVKCILHNFPDAHIEMIGMSRHRNSVVANVDGTVLERLEAMMDPLGGYDPVLGFQVTKVSSLATDPDALFTVNGRCLITSLTGEVTTVVATTTTMKLSDVTNTIDLCAATTITTDAVGTMYQLGGVKADVLNGGIATVVGSLS